MLQMMLVVAKDGDPTDRLYHVLLAIQQERDWTGPGHRASIKRVQNLARGGVRRLKLAIITLYVDIIP